MKINICTTHTSDIFNRWLHLPRIIRGFFGISFYAVLMLALIAPIVAISQPYTNPDPVVLGTAGNYRILAGSAITINGACTVAGDIGLSPTGGASITGAGTVTGIKYSTDGLGVGTVLNATLAGTKTDLDNAYIDIAGRTITGSTGAALAASLDGQNLGCGIYSAGTFSLTTTLTLTGTASDIFIFQSAATLTTGASSHVTLVGVLSSNVFWQVTSSATIDGDFKGNILALTSITQTNGTVDGRLLARNGFVTVSGPSVLPVELVSFTATANRTDAELHWSTTTEINNYGFEIERRQTAAWEKITFVAGAGTSNAPRDYSYTDYNLSPGRYMYRIKQIDNDGTFSYHSSAEVEIGLAVRKFALESNYPNPFNPTTTITFTLAQDGFTTLKIYDLLGREVSTLVNGEMKSGVVNTVRFNASKLSSGVYFSRLESNGNVQMKTLMLLK